MTNVVSKRELEVLELISHEFNSGQIANQLYISVNTVVTHRKSLLKKLRATNAAGLVRRGFEYGLLHLRRA